MSCYPTLLNLARYPPIFVFTDVHQFTSDPAPPPSIHLLTMGDSWEDEEFEVDLPPPSATNNSWEDEVEEEEVPVVPKVDPAVLERQKEMQKKKEAEEALALANKVKNLELANETPEQKKLREKMQAEAADLDAASELFGGKGKSSGSGGNASISAGIAGTSLKTIKDHETFALTIAGKLEESKSTSYNIAAFYMKLTDQIKGKLTIESIEEVIASLNVLKEKKKASEVKPKTVTKKTVAQIKKETKKHEEIFGGGDYDDKYASYEVIIR